MFVRLKKNKSGSVSVQIIDKSKKYKVIQTVGSSNEPDGVKQLVAKGRQIIQTCDGRQKQLFSFKTKEEIAVKDFLTGREGPNIILLIFGPPEVPCNMAPPGSFFN